MTVEPITDSRSPVRSVDRDESTRALRLSAALVLGMMLMAIAAIGTIRRRLLWANGAFYSQFAQIELPAIVLVAGFAVVVLLLTRRNAADSSLRVLDRVTRRPMRTVAWIALAASAVSLAGTYVVFHAYPFVDDEYSGWFQAVIFSTGRSVGTVPQAWCPWITGLAPAIIRPVGPCTWQVAYLPIHAMIRGAFMAAHVDTLTEPVLAGLCVILVGAIARRAWPVKPHRAIIAALFLACSTQFLLMAMTPFAMTAHLFFALLWLWVYLIPGLLPLVLLPWIGVIALGVHSPMPHVLFVAPFLLRFLLQRRWTSAFYIAAVYALGLVFWAGKFFHPAQSSSISTPISTAAGSDVATTAASFAAHPHFNALVAGMSLSLLTTWALPITMICAVVALLRWRRLDAITQWIALSLISTLAGRFVFFAIQGVGWGYRFAHAALGCLALLAAVGLESVAESVGATRAFKLGLGAVAASVFVLLPLRSWQAERIVRPDYETSKWLEGLPADVVLINSRDASYGVLMVRNDPFLRTSPKIIDAAKLRPSEIAALEAAHPGRVRRVNGEELRHLGLR